MIVKASRPRSRISRRPQSVVAIAALFAMALSHAATSLAATTYQASAQGCGSLQTVTRTGIRADASAAPGSCDGNGSTGQGSAFAGPDGLGCFSEVEYFCCGSYVALSDIARFDTEFIVDGPAGTANVGFFMDLASVLTNDPSYGNASMTVNVILGNSTGIGDIASGGYSLFNGMSGFPMGVPTPTRITVNPVPVPVGVPVALSVELIANAGGFGGHVLCALEVTRLSFATSGPVFALPPGYTVRDIPDLLVFGNRFGATTDVPLPGQLAGAPPRIELSPNPCRGPVAIRCAGPVSKADGGLAVYDIDGRHVRTLSTDAAGTATWDRLDDRGAQVHPGVYMVRSESANGVRSTRRLVVLR